jgi:hypothetical protein
MHKHPDQGKAFYCAVPTLAASMDMSIRHVCCECYSQPYRLLTC